ncbi:unnamed protein product [Blepharisma stoltei]|uniref:Enoyl reductase (ER) domain-containing protein n=1 Tax=Blepharisma stoltei TaxID=1481888 RepID=A0AAU9JEE8_9CILI|nr:unnamed protein product [Blepharisma stoltei]
MVRNSYELLGSRAPQPCNLGDAHGVAMAFLEPGTTVTPLPFRHPELLDNEVRVNVTHAGCCHTDVFYATQAWSKNGSFPLVPGHEFIGIVEKVGEKVTHLQPGDKIGFGTRRDCCETCEECKTGLENHCLKRKHTYDPEFGGYATSFQAKSKFCHKLDDDFPGEAAPLFCAGITVFPPLINDVRPGMKVGVVGIGGLGHLALKFAKAMGAEVTAISSSQSKEADARNLGAHHFLNLRDENQVKSASRSLNYIINTATSFSIEQCCGLLKPKGILNLCGAPEAGTDLHFNLFQLLTNDLRVQSNLTGSEREVDRMLNFVRLHSIYPVVEVYNFADTQSAINSLAHGNPHYPNYRAVLEMGSFMKTFSPAN